MDTETSLISHIDTALFEGSLSPDLHYRIKTILKESQYANHRASALYRELRGLTRFAQGLWDATQTARHLGWYEDGDPDIGRVIETAGSWHMDDVYPAPLRNWWITPETHPFIGRARAVAEAAADRRDALIRSLRVRLQQVGERWTDAAAAAQAGVSLGAWQTFCAEEDRADAKDDRAYREVGVLAGEIVPCG